MLSQENEIELHPWKPFIPDGARVLIMGTFPPQEKRWSMDFYYPNRTNDFWKICGLIFLGDPAALYNPDKKSFDKQRIIELVTEHHIAMSDTGKRIRRLKGNASDKFLEIVEPTNLRELLCQMPLCRNVATTGEKAAGIIAAQTGTEIPKMGEKTITEDGINLWRMPSTSRAYPLKLEKKAEFYAELFRAAKIL